jgi:hypothetical protein
LGRIVIDGGIIAPAESSPGMLLIGCFVLPLAVHLPYIGVALREPSELGRLARLITISSGAAYVIPILMLFALVFGYRSVAKPEKRAAVRWVLIPFTLGTFAYYGLGQTARRDHWAPLDPVDLVPRTLHPRLGSYDRVCGA